MERRLSGRIKSVFPIIANYKKSDYRASLVGETVNISDGGACLVVDRPLPVDSEIQLQIKIPPDYSFVIPDKIGDLETDAKIVWIDPPYEFHNYRCGIKFLNDENPVVSTLKEILQNEEEIMARRDWQVSHPKASQPTIPISHRLLEGLFPTALSVDITNLCNLRCIHCFWDSYDTHLPTTTNENILDQVRIALEKFPTITNVTWYGGEPLINRRTTALVGEGIKLRKNNLVITNGTMPIPDWHENVHFAVSIDGAREIHDKIRGKGTYDRIKHNVMVAMEHDIPLAFLYCINTMNIDCIPDFLLEWADTEHIGIVFTVYVPLKNKEDKLAITPKQREELADLLLKMKARYGEAICNTELMIELIRGKYSKELKENCPMNVFNNHGRVHCLHMCNDGSIRAPCAIGPAADHLECRSVTKVALYAGTVLHDRKSFLSLLRMYLSKPHDKDKIHVISFGK